MFIYKITNLINGKAYIGADSSDQKKGSRWREHRRLTRKYLKENTKSSKYLYNAMMKYGINNFLYEIIDNAKSWNELMDLEIFYIKKYNTFLGPGYNMTPGGEGVKTLEHWSKRMSIEEFDKWKALVSETVTNIWDSYSEEERNERISNIMVAYSNKIENMTDEEYKEYCQDMYEPLRKYKMELSEEEKKESLEYMQDKWKEWFESLNDDGREEFKEQKRLGILKKWNSLTDEERQKICEERSDRAKNWWKNMSLDERLIISEKMASKKRRHYILTSPSGQIIKVDNLYSWSEENNINHRALDLRARGKRKSLVNGWECEFDK